MNDQLNFNNSEPEKEEVLPNPSFNSDLQPSVEETVVSSTEETVPVFSDETAKEMQNNAESIPAPSMEGFTVTPSPIVTEEYLKFLEKKEIRKAATAVGLCFLAGHLFMLVLNLIYSVVGGIVSVTVKNGMAIMTDPMVIQAIEIVFSIFVLS